MGGLKELVGNNVQQIRKARGVSQEELAEKISLTRASLSNLERGQQNITLSTLEELSTALKVNVTEFFNQVKSPINKIDEEYAELKKKHERLIKSLKNITDDFNI